MTALLLLRGCGALCFSLYFFIDFCEFLAANSVLLQWLRGTAEKTPN
jgi:hypothetical protein